MPTVTDCEVLGRRLCYVLRYAANDMGLPVKEGGYVPVEDLLQLPLMRHVDSEALVNCIEHDTSATGQQRFQTIASPDGKQLVRAAYNRRIDKGRFHDGTRVVRLLDSCYDLVTKEIDRYDVSNLPTAFLNSLILRLSNRRKLNRKSLSSLVGPNVESLNLVSCYLSRAALQLIRRCSHLMVLSLRDQGYLITDHSLSELLKGLPLLEVLSLQNCSHLTDRCVESLLTCTPRLRSLNLIGCNRISSQAVLKCLLEFPSLTLLEFSRGRMDKEHVTLLKDTACQRRVRFNLVSEDSRSYLF